MDKLDRKNEIIRDCASTIVSLLITTKISERDKFLNLLKEMLEIGEYNEEFDQEMNGIYKNTIRFIETMWSSDFKKIHDIVFDNIQSTKQERIDTVRETLETLDDIEDSSDNNTNEKFSFKKTSKEGVEGYEARDYGEDDNSDDDFNF